ncbi:MAG: putative Ig domain-containing protein [Verrucomicrobiota bacterium]|nr:putative Ig domain-containing protein [Verrucomicrobiota bacterium]
MNKTSPLAATACAIALLCPQHIAVAQTIAPAFANDYSLVDLGSAQGVPTNYGGLTLKSGDPNTLLLGGAANGASGAIYAIGVTRDANNHIIGFSGNASLFSTAPNIDGGLAYGPGGVLFYTGYPSNELGQIKPGSSTPDKVFSLSPLGVASSVGTVQFVAPGFPDAGAIRIASYNQGGFYSGTLTADGMGTFNLSGVAERTNTAAGPEGIVYVPAGAPVFSGPSMLISEYSANRVSAYSLDANGIPVPASRQDFITGLNGALGAYTDPITKDFLFSTYGGGNHVVAVRGFVVPPCTPPPAGMVSWYPLDGTGADIQDGNSGTPQGNVTFVNGRVDRAARFGGTGNTSGVGDRILVGSPTNLQLQDFTIDAWIKRTSATIVTNNGRAGVEGGTFFAWGAGGYGFIIDQATGRLALTKVEESAVFSTSTITDTNYHHVAVTKAGSTVTFYIDGRADAPVNYNTTFTFTTAAAIGARGDNDVNNAFFGDIDELEIFSRSLSGTEVGAIFNAGSAGKCRTCATPPSGMVSWWPADGNFSDIRDGNNGTPQGTVTFVPGEVAQAFHFDGSSFVSTTSAANLAFERTNSFSLDAWVRSTETTVNHFIVAKRQLNAPFKGYALMINNGQTPKCYSTDPTPPGAGSLSFFVDGSDTANCPRDHAVIVYGSTKVNDGQWHHVSATYDGSGTAAGVKIYVDGVIETMSVISDNLGTNSIANTDPFTIGAGSGNGPQPFNGEIDEVEVFNRALSQTEIQAIVNAGNAGKCKPVPCPTITLSPSTLPGGTVGTSYSQTVSASGGSGTYTYSVSSGSLPPGLTLNTSTGQISGTPTTTTGSPFSFTIKATDSSTSCTGSQSYTVTISCPATTLSPTTLPDGQVNSAYDQTVTASGTGGAYTYAVTTGSLPAGLTLSAAGRISGTPTRSGSSSFTITATDTSAGCSGSRAYSIQVNCPATTVSPSTLPNGQVGMTYNQTITASGTGGTYTFAVTSGTLPNGLTLSSSGQLSGTPTQSGPFNFTITATDSSANCAGSRGYSVTIAAAPTPTPTPTPTPPVTCTVCHKGVTTLMLPCNSLSYAGHKAHGDRDGACPP